MPQGPTIVYLNGLDANGTQSAHVASSQDLIMRMVEQEPAVHNALMFHQTFIDCMQYTCTGNTGKGPLLSSDERALARFCKEALVYYYALGFVAFRLVPSVSDKRTLEPHCIPIRHITFEMATDDFESTHKTPTVRYRNTNMFMRGSGAPLPQIFVYRFPATLLDAFCLGPLCTLIPCFVEMLKVREHNAIVLAEHANNIKYVENIESTGQRAQEGSAIGSIMSDAVVATHKKQTVHTLSSRDVDFTREMIHEQLEHNEHTSLSFLEQRPTRFVVLPKNTHMNSNTAPRTVFASCIDTSSQFDREVARLFAIPERGTRGSEDMPLEPMGVRNMRVVYENMLTMIASVLADPKLDAKLQAHDESRKAPTSRKAFDNTTGGNGIALCSLHHTNIVEVSITMDPERLSITSMSHGYGLEPRHENRRRRRSSVPSTPTKRARRGDMQPSAPVPPARDAR